VGAQPTLLTGLWIKTERILELWAGVAGTIGHSVQPSGGSRTASLV
jgi:hypothetical protein